MSANQEEHVILCQKAIGLVNELCNKNILEDEKCLEFVFTSSGQSPSVTESGKVIATCLIWPFYINANQCCCVMSTNLGNK